MALLFPAGYQFFDANGSPLAAGTVRFYDTGTTNDRSVWSDKALSASISNPYTLDAGGRIAVNIYGSGDYTVLVKNSAGTTIFSRDAVFGWDEIGDLDGNAGSSLVGFIHSAAGAVATTLQARGRLVVYPQDFGATGDGVADDTAELQACIDGADGRVIDLQGLTYKVATTLTLVSNTTLKNGKITFATAADGDVLFEAYGSVGTQYTLTAAPTKGSTSVAVSDATGLAAGDWCFLQSTDNWSASESGKRGEWVRVLSVSGLTINLEQKVRMTYTSGHTMYKPVMIENLTLENLTLTGNGYTGSAAQYGLRAYLCKNVQVIRCVADSFGYAAFSLETVLGGNVTDCISTRSNFTTGAAYGVAITGGCDGVTVKGGRYAYHRHGVTIGGTFFTNFGIAVTGITTMACSDAGIDCHGNALSVAITGNVVDCYCADAVQTGDGITAQGAGITIVGNIIRGWTRDAILAQPLTSAPATDDAWNISGNSISNPEGVSGADAIIFSSEKGAGNSIRSLVIANNTIEAESATTGRGIVIQNTTSGGPIRSITITGNSMYVRDQAISITAANLELIQDVAITGNSAEIVSASVPVCELIANADVSKFLGCVTVAGNTLRGGTYGISLSNTPPRINRGLNVIQGFATAATVGTFAATDGTDVTT